MITKRFPARCVARTVLVAGLIAGVFNVPVAYARVSLNFTNADIGLVAKTIGDATNKTIIVDPRVKGQLNLESQQPVPEDQALKILQGALRAQGFALLQDHGVLKVVPEADAKLQGVPTYIGNTTPARGDQVITQVFRLRHESANNMLPVLRPLISPNNQVTAYPANNTLVVTDYADNVRRIGQIIQGIDTAAAAQVQVIALKNASAVDVAQQLTKLLDPGAVGGTDATLRVTVSADARTNAVMIRASSPSRLAAAKSLVATLDSPTSQPGNIHVVPLRNADAVRLAKTLRAMLSPGGRGGSDTLAGDGKSGSFGGINMSTGTPGSLPLPSGLSSATSGRSMLGSSRGMAGGGFGMTQSRDQSFSDRQTGGDDGIQGGGVVQADAATNSLIIVAPDPLYRNLRSVVDQLDQRRAQVYIEAIIADMRATNNANLGIQWQGGLLSSGGNNGFYAGSNFNSAGSQSVVGLTATGLGIAQNPTAALASGKDPFTLLNQGLNIGLLHRFGKIFGLGGLLQALAANKDTNILSTPNLITLDNEEARIVVGENVPIVTGSYATPTANTTTGISAFNTYDRQDVGITLHIKPQITEGNVLKLQIYQENSNVSDASIKSEGGVSIIKRSIQSTVLADDGEIIVLGGLIQDQYENGNAKVPWFGDIPVIGSLFRSEKKRREKSNMMVFLRPVIVRDQATSTQLAMNHYDYMRAEQGGYQSDNRIIRDKQVPMLPQAPQGPSEGGGPAVNNIFDLRSAYGRRGAHTAGNDGVSGHSNSSSTPAVNHGHDAAPAVINNGVAPAVENNDVAPAVVNDDAQGKASLPAAASETAVGGANDFGVSNRLHP